MMIPNGVKTAELQLRHTNDMSSWSWALFASNFLMIFKIPQSSKLNNEIQLSGI